MPDTDGNALARDQALVRRAISLAWQARNAGEDPFGALLARDGLVVAESADRCLELRDPTAHAEMGLISGYCRGNGLLSLEGLTLYCSTEPCAMCSGAIHWSHVSRVVFSVAQAGLQELTGGKPKGSCKGIINSGGRQVEVVGPILADEGLAVFDGYLWIPKATRNGKA